MASRPSSLTNTTLPRLQREAIHVFITCSVLSGLNQPYFSSSVLSTGREASQRELCFYEHKRDKIHPL